MRLMISALLSAGVLACGGHSNPAPDSLQGDTTLTIHTYQASGPVDAQLVAVQDGDGPWTALTGTAGVYTTTLHAGRYGVMTSCTSAMSNGVSIWYAAVSDGTTLYFDDCADPGAASATISGTVTGAPAADATSVIDAYFGEVDLPAGTTTYMLQTLAGAERLIAEDLVDMRPVKLATADATVVDGATVSFDLSAGFAPVTHALTGTGIALASLAYRDAHGITFVDHPPSPFDTFRAIPADKLGSGLNRLSVSNNNGAGVIRYFKDPADEQITLPAPLQLAQQPTAKAAPYPNVHFVVPVQTGAIYDLDFSTTNTTTNTARGFSIELTPAWIAAAFPGAASVDYTAPDFRALAGWKADYQPETGIALDWTVSATKQTNIDWFPTAAPDTMFDHDGSELAFTSVSGQLAAP